MGMNPLVMATLIGDDIRATSKTVRPFELGSVETYRTDGS
jgi:hypothetical protein